MFKETVHLDDEDFSLDIEGCEITDSDSVDGGAAAAILFNVLC